MNNAEDEIISQTRQWLENVVLTYNFCPFAHKPYREKRIRFALSKADSLEDLTEELTSELLMLNNVDSAELETTLFIIPGLLSDFNEFNQFGAVTDYLLSSLGFAGEIQIATFHPDYQFADLSMDDVRNYTNRSPYPVLHLIRESSVFAARQSYKNIEEIPENNMQKCLELGLETLQSKLKPSP